MVRWVTPTDSSCEIRSRRCKQSPQCAVHAPRPRIAPRSSGPASHASVRLFVLDRFNHNTATFLSAQREAHTLQHRNATYMLSLELPLALVIGSSSNVQHSTAQHSMTSSEQNSDERTLSSPPLSNTRPNAVLPHATPTPRLSNWVCGNDVPARTPPSIGGELIGQTAAPGATSIQAYRRLSYLSPSTLPQLSHFLLVDLSLTANSDPHLKDKYLNSPLSV